MRLLQSKASLAGFLLTVAVLLGNATVSQWHTSRLVEHEKKVEHTQAVLRALEDSRATIAEAETGQRGYLITGDPRYLTTYEKAVVRGQSQLAVLEDLTADNPAQQARAAALKQQVDSRLARLKHNIELRQEKGFQAAREIVGTDQGQQLMEQIRQSIEQMEHVEHDLLAIRASNAAHSLRMKNITNVIGTLLGIAAVCLAFVFFQRTLNEGTMAEGRARRQARREAALGELRQRALSDTSLDTLMNRAVQLVAEVLDVPLVKVLQLLPDGDAFLLQAGVGWHEGCVGHTAVGAALDSQAGYTLYSSKPVVVGDLTTHEPVIVEDMRKESRFTGPALLLDHGVVSGVSVIIYDQPERPFGILGAHTTRQRSFTQEEAHFLQGMANILAAAIQRRRAEQALSDRERHFHALADSVPEIVWTSLPDGGCDYVNQRWHDFTGLTFEETKGFGWVAALYQEDVQRSKERWMHSVETGELFACEYRFRRKDGTYRWCLGRAWPLCDEQGRTVKWFGNCMDVDEYKRMEKALKDADRRKDEFLAMLAHELRNPLTPITNAVALLRLKAPNDPDIQWSTDVIVRQTEKIVRLVDDLLDVSSIVHGKMRLEKAPVDLSTIVTRALETCQPPIESRHHELTVSFPEEPIWLHADAMRLIEVVENLLTNAARYTNDGGQIWLSVDRDGGEAVLRVRDTGIGIEPEMLPQIFELFRQAEHPTARSRAGLGLGLKLVASLVEMHGGSVQAFSAGPGTGSEFIVRLPALLKPPHDEAPTAEAAKRATRPPEAQRVLIVDDQRIIADSLARLLCKKGHEVRTANDGPTALEQAADFCPSVVLADINLPGMDGFELANLLRQHPECQQATLIALTGFAHQDMLQRVREAGFNHLLVKPPNLVELDHLLTSAAPSDLHDVALQ
jgi:PAS domain S-box-containing protein